MVNISGKVRDRKKAHKNISGEQDRQRGGVLGVIKIQVLLKALEACVGQIIALSRCFSGTPETEQSLEY